MREEKYDIAKAIAIYFVVLGHMFDQLGLVDSNIINFTHMPVFFFISGYFLYNTIDKYSIDQFVKKKVKSLLIPYFAWSFISFVANISMLMIRRSFTLMVLKEEFIQIFLFARSTWFFIVLFFSAIFLALFCYYSKSRYWKLQCILAWLLFSLLPIHGEFAIYKFKWLFPFMLLGYLIAEYKSEYSITRQKRFLGGGGMSYWISCTCKIIL